MSTLNPRADGKAGRPLKLTKQVREDYCYMRSTGMAHEACAQYAGISYSAARNWRERGEIELSRREAGEAPIKDENAFVQFVKELQVAEANAAYRWQETINTAARSNPTWAAYMLERRYPNEYRPAPLTTEVVNKITFTADDAVAAKRELEEWKRQHNPAPQEANPPATGGT
jgi:hypothetical protein